jgi:hypothetical protein
VVAPKEGVELEISVGAISSGKTYVRRLRVGRADNPLYTTVEVIENDQSATTAT